VAVVLLAGGALIGWTVRGALQPAPVAMTFGVADAVDSYAFFRQFPELLIEFTTDRTTDFDRLGSHVLGMPVPRPDLSPLDYEYVGSRIVPRGRSAAGLLVFDQGTDARIVVFFWPPDDSPARPPQPITGHGDVAGYHGVSETTAFAVIGDGPADSLGTVADRLAQQL
jgi:anti-sigma factor RsiW